jgi:hypothetical protein
MSLVVLSSWLNSGWSGPVAPPPSLNSSWNPFQPAFTTFAEVVGHLNISGPDAKGNYTVFGLTVPLSLIQSQIDHANKYIYSLVPSLQEGTVDPRLPSAELAATDLACQGILVTSAGGAMVGAYDYFLGDIRVARTSPYLAAIKAAIAGYHASVITNLANVTTVVVSAVAANAYRGPVRRRW